MTWLPGMVTRADDSWLFVKVPTGADCLACPMISACTFKGPKSAYRTVRVARAGDFSVGDRVSIDEPASLLGVALLAMVGLPIVLLMAGYSVSVCCIKAQYAIAFLWFAGFVVWFASLYGAPHLATRSR